MTSADGKMGVANGSEPFHEVLRETRATKFDAVADDLSLFGGVDTKKRMWIQRGLDADPEILATGVERVIWGPISHRALVIDENGKGRFTTAVIAVGPTWVSLRRLNGVPMKNGCYLSVKTRLRKALSPS